MERRPGSVMILVHGTFGGSQEEHGRLWWQRGGAFRDWLEARLDGTGIEVRPFRWSGLNSETERRRSGRDLLALLRDLDGQGRAYHLVGHSHGGSVIWSALRESNVNNAKHGVLKGLKSWTTAGTPFLVYGVRYADILFLGPLLVALFLILRLVMGLVTAVGVRDALFTGAHAGDLLLLGLLWPVVGVVLLFCLGRIWTVVRAAGATFWDYYGDLAAWWGYTSGGRWLQLCADQDEAVNGLGKVLSVQEAIVPRGGLLKVFGGVADGIFWQQVRAIAFGNDLPGRKPAHAGYAPLLEDAAKPLTVDDHLNRRLVERANAGSPLVADRLRRMLGELAYGKLVRADLPADAGTAEGEDWTAILVHCTYFSDLPDGADVEGPAADATVAARVAAHVLEHESVDPTRIPADEVPARLTTPPGPAWLRKVIDPTAITSISEFSPIGLLARRRSLFRSRARGHFTLGTVQTLTSLGLIFLLVVAGLGIALAQRRAWSLTDDAQAVSVLRESVGLLSVCNDDDANADWCRALLEASIVVNQKRERLGFSTSEVLEVVDDRRLDEDFDQIGIKARFDALLAASDRLAQVGLTSQSLRFLKRALAMVPTVWTELPLVDPVDPDDLKKLLECARRYSNLGDQPEAMRIVQKVARDSMRNVEILHGRKGFVNFREELPAASLHTLLAALTERLRLDPENFDDAPLDRIAALITDRSSATNPDAPAVAVTTLAALLKTRGRAAKEEEVGRLVGGASPSKPSFADSDPEVVKAEARAYHDRLRTEPLDFNPSSQAANPVGAAFRERIKNRIQFLATSLRLGLADLQRDALNSLCEDARRIFQGGLQVETSNGPRTLIDPPARDWIVWEVLHTLATEANADGLCDLIKATPLTKLVPPDSSTAYIPAKLRLLEAHCAWKQGHIAEAVRIGDGLKADRDRNRWAGITKKQRSDLNRALAVIDCAARGFRDARSESEKCDIEDRLHVWAELLRQYCDAASSPSTSPGSRPGGDATVTAPIFDVVEIVPAAYLSGVVAPP